MASCRSKLRVAVRTLLKKREQTRRRIRRRTLLAHRKSGALVPYRLAAHPGLLGTPEWPSVRRSLLVGGLFHFSGTEAQ
jgi:hypothetical protein